MSNIIFRMNKAINTIEERLTESPKLEEIASIAAFSPYHFHRLFHSIIGDSFASYVRKRRLVQSCQDLRAGERVLDVALKYGFESQESYTRAFKKLFEITPGKFQKASSIEQKASPLGLNKLEELTGGRTMEATIVNTEKMYVIGMAEEFAPHDFEGIYNLWQRFSERQDQIQNKHSMSLGVCCEDMADIPPENREHFIYMTSWVVDGGTEVPEGMQSLELEAGKYAKFTYQGHISGLNAFIKHIWQNWVPSSGFELRKAPDFELYDERFKLDSNDSEVDIFIPIK